MRRAVAFLAALVLCSCTGFGKRFDRTVVAGVVLQPGIDNCLNESNEGVFWKKHSKYVGAVEEGMRITSGAVSECLKSKGGTPEGLAHCVEVIRDYLETGK